MLTETELKLQLPVASLAAIPGHPLVQARLDGGWQHLELFNQYYDTPDLALDRAGFALRLRRDGDCLIQTLKGRGCSLAGLSVRQEWDWYLERPELSLASLQQPDLPEEVRGLNLSRLAPLFRTDFERQKGLLCWQYQGEPVALELALDVGEVTSQTQRRPIRELELELRQGPAAALRELALQLARDLVLLPSDTAKAERGYQLLDPARRPPLPPLPEIQLPCEQRLSDLIHGLLATALNHAQGVLMGQPSALAALRVTLMQLIRAQRLAEQLAAAAAPLSNQLEQFSAALAASGSVTRARALLEETPQWGWLALSLAQAAEEGGSGALWTDAARTTLNQLCWEIAHAH